MSKRLTHGEDKESEENIMSIAFAYQKCYKIPSPKLFSGTSVGTEEERDKLQNLAKKVFNDRDPELLSKLQDLPYLNPKYKLE